MSEISDVIAQAMRNMTEKLLEVAAAPSPLLERLKASRPHNSCDCHACRVASFPPISPARTIHEAAAQEAAKPPATRKAAKPRPRFIADEWADRR